MPVKRVVVIGSNGQLGTDLMKVFGDADATGLMHADLEITDSGQVLEVLGRLRPSYVVNTAAYHRTDSCEQNVERAFEVNAGGALNLARACQALRSTLVHVSTDYVFDGAKGLPYTEEDPVRPLSVYGISKVAGEHAVGSYCERHYIVRSSGLYGLVPCRAKGDNFITKILKTARERGKVRVVTDEVATPTWTYSLAVQIERLCRDRGVPFGVVHATDEGECSWYDFTAEIFRLTGTRAELEPAKVSDFPAAVPRPSYSVLENRVLKRAGANVVRDWRDSLAAYLRLSSTEA